MTSPGGDHPETGSGSDASSGYEYPSLERSTPPADAASSANPVPPNLPPAWETPGAPPIYPAYPTAPPTYPTAPPSYPQYGQGYPSYPPGQQGAYPPPQGYPVAGGYPGYPAPGYADPYGYSGYGQTSGTNGLAIASLVASILGIFTCGLGSIAGVIMGFIALGQLKTSQQEGKGLAITGIVIGAALILFWLLIMVIGISNSGDTSGSF
ncbi:DUF4190 domain-containing protein [Mycobacterium sp. CBMA271]|uniref:DUF4190 domain-containing protein n=1 Tax=unclassified Mycobacteroides TaxID=2618759 RepID=UPI0012DFADF5|nr:MULTISPECIES: DUF4190 domain-containing protein [unclassified Mycobacteroides]MUM16584.1 hypothetical protein [Mycobacteroides sp. CBMA 326]MUM22108.1 DUF4190 domain-containing protein [Mycobacteroides sp. CBMA 271]